mmetsp:Transcript_28924/g.85627  ORF Transcript_28924/g.85627 Transcript_28924/m.85627 type:complete len:470 (+) Transcript_28924:304-1713(+)
MKFSHLLKFNIVPEWRKEYINYSGLKKTIYAIAKAEADGQHVFDQEDAMHEPLLGDTPFGEHRAFESHLHDELNKIFKFFIGTEAEARRTFNELIADVEKAEIEGGCAGSALARATSRRMSMSVDHRRTSGLLETGSTDLIAPEPASQDSVRHARISFWKRQEKTKTKEQIKQRIADLYLELTDLKQFLEFNHEGFRKILKKHDKMTDLSLKDEFMDKVNKTLNVTKNAEDLGACMQQLIELYSILFLGGDASKALDVLQGVLREQINIERSTVWKDMVAMERKAVGATVAVPKEMPILTFWRLHWLPIMLTFSLVVFVTLLVVPIFQEPEKQHCLAMLTFVSLLWATEAIPLYVTSMMVAPLAVMLRVLVDTSGGEPRRMEAQETASAMFHAMFSQTIMLLLGGFAIAGALSKHFIAKQLAISVMSRVGRKPRNVLLAAMFVATFASMWISNVAAPVLTFSIVLPILK